MELDDTAPVTRRPKTLPLTPERDNYDRTAHSLAPNVIPVTPPTSKISKHAVRPERERGREVHNGEQNRDTEGERGEAIDELNTL